MSYTKLALDNKCMLSIKFWSKHLHLAKSRHRNTPVIAFCHVSNYACKSRLVCV